MLIVVRKEKTASKFLQGKQLNYENFHDEKLNAHGPICNSHVIRKKIRSRSLKSRC